MNNRIDNLCHQRLLLKDLNHMTERKSMFPASCHFLLSHIFVPFQLSLIAEFTAAFFLSLKLLSNPFLASFSQAQVAYKGMRGFVQTFCYSEVVYHMSTAVMIFSSSFFHRLVLGLASN